MKVRPIHIGLLAFVLTSFALLIVILTQFTSLERVKSNNQSQTAFAVQSTRAPAQQAAVEPTQSTPEPTPAADGADVPLPAAPANPSDAFQQGMTLRRNGDYVSAATAFRTVAQNSPDLALARQAQFRLGEMLYLAGDFTNALIALDAVVKDKPDDDYAARARYFLGDMYTQRQQYDNALAQLRAYRQTSRALMGYIDEEIADVMVAAGDSAGAIKQYDVALEDATLIPAKRVAILLKIADVHSGRGEPGLAAARLGQAFDIAPDNATLANVEYRWGLALNDAGETDQAIAHWKHALAMYTSERGAYDSVVKLVEVGATGIDDLQRGIADYYADQYDVALQALRRYISTHDVPGADVVYYAALAYKAQGNYAGALRNYEVVLQSYPGDKRVPDALYGKAMALSAQGNSSDAFVVLRQLAKQYPAYGQTDDGWWQIGQALENVQQYARAAQVYQELVATFPASGWAPAALYNAGLSYYFAQDPQHAAQAWDQTIRSYPASQHADSAAYWLGKLAHEQGDQATADKFFRQATGSPRTYYSWRALDALGNAPPPATYDLAAYTMLEDKGTLAQMEQWIAGWSGAKTVSRNLPNAVLSDPYFKRGAELAGLDRAMEARPQFAALNERFNDDAVALYALARYYRDNNYFSVSIDAAERLARLSGQSDAQLPRYLRQLIYPTYFADLIVPYAEKNGFDPALFFGLVRQESGYNPLSYSSAAARGLTQVIPDTALGIARSLKVSNFKQDDLFKPYISVRFGTYFFGVVLDQFNGSPFYALMGYNGGPGNAKKWQRADLDEAVEHITLPESYLYVRTVYSQYRQYVDIYRAESK